MTDNLKEEIHNKHYKLHRMGIKPCLIVVGRLEALHFGKQKKYLLCEIIEDPDSPSRLDVYGLEPRRSGW